jgi:hypothetical protein
MHGLSKCCVRSEVIDQQLKVTTQHLHRDTPTVRVPNLGVVEFVRDLIRPLDSHVLRHFGVMRLRDLPVLELVLDKPFL